MNNLKTLREIYEMTSQSAAHNLGVSTSTIYNWENGITCPNHTNRKAIEKFYGINADKVFGKSFTSKDIEKIQYKRTTKPTKSVSKVKYEVVKTPAKSSPLSVMAASVRALVQSYKSFTTNDLEAISALSKRLDNELDRILEERYQEQTDNIHSFVAQVLGD